MLLNCLKWILLILGVCFIFDFLIFLIVKSKIKDNVKISDLMGFLGIEFGVYILSALIFAIYAFIKIGYYEGFILLLFALSPFIIGHLAKYKTRHLFTIIQFLVIILNVVYGFRL